MKKQFINVFLCGTMILSAGSFTSCSDDNDDLKSRLTVVEGAIAELKDQLSKALTTGASIVSSEEVEGVWTLKLSNGDVLVIKGSTGGSTGGGSDVTVVENESDFTITVNGTAYVIPKGAAVNSLVYCPEYADGLVLLGNDGAKVKFLATPAVSADALKNATFSVADAREVKTRAGAKLFKVSGEVTIDDDLVVVPLKGIKAEAGKTYTVAMQMSLSGTTISSNYFTVQVDEDFFFSPEEIGGYEIKAEYGAKALADNFEEVTFKGLDFLKVTNFKDMFSTLPEGAIFELAEVSEQPGGHAQEKWNTLNKNLSSDGTWAFNERLGTSFNGNDKRAGFLLYVTADDVIKAKIYIVINDELAGLDFTAVLPGGPEAEWGGREFSLAAGAQTVDFQKAITEYTTMFPIIHGGTEFFEKWTKTNLSLNDESDVLYHDGEKLVLGSVGKAYAEGSKGIHFFCRGFAIYTPESLATADGKYIDENGKAWSGGEGFGYDFWGSPNPDDIAQKPMLDQGLEWGFNITADGKVTTPASYTGYGLRLGIGAIYEYAYGTKKIGGGDQFGLYFINRRVTPAGATMPAAQK